MTCVKEQRGPVTQKVTRTAKANVRLLTMDMPVTKVLIALNATIFVFTELLRTNTTLSQTNLALYQPYVASGEWYRIVTSGFLHFGFLHIIFNMMILLRLGETLERAMGSLRFAGLYFVALLGGSAGALLLEPKGLVGGASGAVFGLMGAVVLSLRQRGVPFSQTQYGPLLIMNLVITFAIPGISKGGHLGGLLFGGIAGALLMHPRRRGKSLSQDLAILVGLGLVALLLCVVLAKNPVLTSGRLKFF